jgi:hypothetical protein
MVGQRQEHRDGATARCRRTPMSVPTSAANEQTGKVRSAVLRDREPRGGGGIHRVQRLARRSHRRSLEPERDGDVPWSFTKRISRACAIDDRGEGPRLSPHKRHRAVGPPAPPRIAPWPRRGGCDPPRSFRMRVRLSPPPYERRGNGAAEFASARTAARPSRHDAAAAPLAAHADGLSAAKASPARACSPALTAHTAAVPIMANRGRPRRTRAATPKAAKSAPAAQKYSAVCTSMCARPAFRAPARADYSWHLREGIQSMRAVAPPAANFLTRVIPATREARSGIHQRPGEWELWIPALRLRSAGMTGGGDEEDDPA